MYVEGLIRTRFEFSLYCSQ